VKELKMQLRQALESFIETSSPGTPKEEARVEEAGRLLTELIQLEGRTRRVEEAARRLFEQDQLWELANARRFGLWGLRGPADASARETTPFSNGDPSLGGVTLHEAARRVLEEEGRPMHVQELGARIKARGWRHPRSRAARSDQINFQLAARLPRHPETFQRVAPNTFALAAWGDSAPVRQRPKPRLPLFSSPHRAPDGRPWSEWIGDHPEAPFEDEEASWHSS